MKRLFASLVTALFCAVSLQAQYRNPLDRLEDTETVRALKEHVAYLSSAALEGRKAGSEGEKMAADYLADKLKEYGIDVLSPQGGSTFGLAREGEDTLYSRNVWGFLQGWDREMNGRYIVIGARLDNLGMDTYTVDGETVPRIYYGANGNASGMAMLLELAQRLSYARTLVRRSILFVGFGASQETLAGSWYFLNRAFSDTDRIDAMVNLDMVGAGGGPFYAYTSSNEDLNAVVAALQGELLPIQASLTTQEPYPGDHRAFYAREIPSVLFTTGRYPEHDTGRDSFDILDFPQMERELEYVYCFVQRLCNGPRPLFRNDSLPKKEAPAGTYAYADVDVKPMFLNSADPRTFMEKWVYQYLKYPQYAQENGIQGRVLVDFVVDEKGEVRDVKVSRGIHESLDQEAIRVVSASPKWRPGRRGGKKVNVAMTIAVDFRLTKDNGGFGINGVRVN